MFNKLISSAQRSLRKKRTLKQILKKKQFNNSVINLHRMDLKNAGDYYCAPHHYFDALKNTSLDLFDYKSEEPKVLTNFIEKISSNSLIIGGGGLLNRSGFKMHMKLFEKLVEKEKKIVLWGLGHNSKHQQTYGNIKNYNIDVKKFGLVGTRDFNMPGEYLPCVSCMNSNFSLKYEETQEIGVVFHKDTLKKPEILKQFKSYPTSSNTTDLESLVHFIGSSNKIITDSYHVMYWSMLLNKNVAVVPNSSKFYDFKYQPIFTSFDNFNDSIFKSSQSYSGVIEECRELNHKFAEKAFNYLNL